MTGYQSFNAVEAGIWMLIACGILIRARPANARQMASIVLATVAFLAFGVTDLLEMNYQTAIAAWLWGLKIACGTAILASRYTWLGWSRFRWRDREVLFALACLAAVIAVILLQSKVSGVPGL